MSSSVLRVGSELGCATAWAWTLFSEKGRLDRKDRFAQGDWAKVSPRSKIPRVWFHAASVGEVDGIRTILEGLEDYSAEIVISTTSSTGKKRAESLADFAALLPLDHPRFIKPLLERIRPDVLVITETEIWPQLYLAAKELGVPLLMINARISDYSYPRYRMFRTLLKPILEIPEHILAQTEKDAFRFESLGARTVSVSGSSKYDAEIQPYTELEKRLKFAELGFDLKNPCFVAGSVRPGEIDIVLDAYLDTRQAVPGLQLLLAPRHPEKFAESAELLKRRGLEFHCRTSGKAEKPQQIVLLDTLGELKYLYGIADFAFVGATLVDIGGHNPLEPAAFGAPVILGPHARNVRDAVADLKRNGGMVEVTGRTSLGSCLLRLSEDLHYRRRMGAAAKATWVQHRGATDKILKVLFEYLKECRVSKVQAV